VFKTLTSVPFHEVFFSVCKLSIRAFRLVVRVQFYYFAVIVMAPERRVMTDQAYLLVQVWMIIVLLCADGLTAVVEHPAWFQ
jgi:hypothetical protein